MRLTLIIFTLLHVGSPNCTAQSITNVQWKTRYAAPANHVDGRFATLVRGSVATLGEAGTIQASVIGGLLMGLDGRQSAKLAGLLQTRYSQLKTNSLYTNYASQLPYCYARQQPTNGSATIYIPKHPNDDLHPILFLHGYGGSFLWCLDSVIRAYPDHVVVAPAHGVSSAAMNHNYAREAIEQARKSQPESGFKKKPIIVGLSAGGAGGFQIYARRRSRYAGLISIAAPPPQSIWRRFGRHHRIHILHGTDEPFATNGFLDQGMDALRDRDARISAESIPDGDHFFLLEFEEQSNRLLRKAMDELSKKE